MQRSGAVAWLHAGRDSAKTVVSLQLHSAKTVVSLQLQFVEGRRHPYRAAEAHLHGPVLSWQGGQWPCCEGDVQVSQRQVLEVSVEIPQLQLVEKLIVPRGAWWTWCRGPDGA